MPNAKHFKTTGKWHCLNCQYSKPNSIASVSSSTSSSSNNVSNHNNHTSKTSLKLENHEKSQVKKRKLSNVQSPEGSSGKASKKQAARQFGKGKKFKKSETGDDLNGKINVKLEDEGEIEASEDLEEDENGDDLEVEVDDMEDDKEDNDSKANSSNNSKKNQKGKRQAKSNKSGQVKKLKPLSEGRPMSEKEYTACRNLINEMRRNENAWPFLDKVDESAYPDYYEVITEPMDLNTIKTNFKNKEYKTKEQFAYDCRLIFDNCEYFNEDDSVVGESGHKLRALFETKWLKLFG